MMTEGPAVGKNSVNRGNNKMPPERVMSFPEGAVNFV